MITSQVRRRWAMAGMRAQADLTIRRVQWIGAERHGRVPAAGAPQAALDAAAALDLDHLVAPHAQGGAAWAGA